MVKVVAAIPCFNTEPFIGDIVSQTKHYVDQVVVINDGSSDGTIKAARAAGAEVVNHGQNRGYGEAIKSCFEAARLRQADVLVILDGDGQHNPEEIPRLLAPILNKDADLVIGSRFLEPKTGTTDCPPWAQHCLPFMPRFRRLGIKVITFLFNFGHKMKVTDTQSGFRAYNKAALDSLRLVEAGMGISIEILAQARKKGFVIKEVPVSCYYFRSSHNMIRAVKHGLGVALAVLRIRRNHST